MTRLLREGEPKEILIVFAKRNGIRNAGSMNAQELFDAMQKQWFQRGKLRYQIEGESPDVENLQLLQKLGYINARFPPPPFIKGYRGPVLLLGALASRVKDRFVWYLELVRKGYISEYAPLYMLGSARPLDPVKESREVLLAPHSAIPSVINWKSVEEMPKTEAEMMRMIVDMRGEGGFANATVIDAPMQSKKEGGFLSPNTGDTVRSWLQEVEPSASCLVISNNPFVEYEALTVWRAIAEETGKLNMTVEGTGPEANIKLPLATFRDNLAKQLYEELKEWEIEVAR